MRPAAAAGVAAALTFALGGCAPTLIQPAGPRSYVPLPAPTPVPPATPPPVDAARRLTSLPGWAEEDHAAALSAFMRGCVLAQAPAVRAVCARAEALGAPDDAAARAFLDRNFRAEPLVGEGVLTGYFAPEYPARTDPDVDFSAAVRPRPADLVTLPAPSETPVGRKVVRQLGEDGEGWAYPDRAGIELTPPVQALAWMRPEDLFFMQVQGSGVLDFPDGRRLRAVYAGDNGRPFVPIAAAMVRRGLLAANQASATSIRAWLRTHRGDAQPVMDVDPRYVFFSLQPDDGGQPAGAAGVRLTPGRSVAADPRWHAYGELLWIDGVAPVLAGAPRSYRRLVVVLDTGSAIRGPVRADLYIGRGEAAGLEAGRVRHTLRLFRLVPREPAGEGGP